MNKQLFLFVLCAGCAAFVDPSFASSTVNDAVENVANNTSSLPSLLNYGSYILGVSLGVSGIHKLRQHTDNSQVPLADGLSRMVGAAFFISLPMALAMMQKTTNVEGGTSGSYHGITALGNT